MRFTYNSRYGSYENCYLIKTTYAETKGMRLDIYNDSELGPISTVTVNLGKLNPGEIAIKDYAENEGMLLEMQRIGLVGEPTRFIKSGFVSVPICYIDYDKLREYAVSTY